MKGRTDMSKRFTTSAKPKDWPASRRAPSKLVLTTVFAVISIAIAAIYVHDWPRMRNGSTGAAPINLAGMGVSPEVAAAINRGKVQAAPAPMHIAPENADMYAGMPMDPAARYEMATRKPMGRLRKK